MTLQWIELKVNGLAASRSGWMWTFQNQQIKEFNFDSIPNVAATGYIDFEVGLVRPS